MVKSTLLNYRKWIPHFFNILFSTISDEQAEYDYTETPNQMLSRLSNNHNSEIQANQSVKQDVHKKS